MTNVHNPSFSLDSGSLESNRRKLLLGAPAALLLSACGGGDGTAGADEDTSAQSKLEANTPQSSKDYAEGNTAPSRSSINPSVEAKARVIVDRMKAFYTPAVTNFIMEASCYATRLTFYATEYNVNLERMISDASYRAQVVSNLTANQINLIKDKLVDRINDSTPYSHPRPASASASAFLNMYSAINTTDDATLNHIMQHYPVVMHDIKSLFYAMSTSYEVPRVFQRFEQIEQRDDARHLRGTKPDTVEIDKGILWGQKNTFSVKLGNLRKPIEKEQPKSLTSWYVEMFMGKSFSPETKIRVGLYPAKVTPTKVEGGYTVTSDAYVIGPEQRAGLDYYINADIEKYGALESLNEAQTRELLQAHADIAFAETGDVYVAYVMGQLSTRMQVQALLGITRFAFLDKRIDLSLLQRSLQDVLSDYPEVIQHYRQDQGMIAIISTVFMLFTAFSLYLSASTIKVANEVISSNTTSTPAKQEAEIRRKLAIRLAASQSVSTLAALGILIGGTLPNNSAFKANFQRLTLPAFSISDITGGIGDIASVLRLKKQNTLAGGLQMAAGSVRILSGTYGMLETFTKVMHNDYSKSLFPTIKALHVSTLSAALGAALYGASIIASIFAAT